MKLALAVLGLLVIAGIAAYAKRRNRWNGPTYVQQLAHWQASDPQMPVLNLPSVAPLKGKGLDRGFQSRKNMRRMK